MAIKVYKCIIVSRCWCEDSETSVPRLIVVDEGVLTSFSDLPMTAISLSGTSFKDQQYQYHNVGPLVCYQGNTMNGVYSFLVHLFPLYQVISHNCHFIL